MSSHALLHRVAWVVVACCIAGSARSAIAADDESGAVQRVRRATEVYRELIATGDREIPEALLKDCDCIAVFPRVYKAAIGFGGRFGKGVASCRNAEGAWSPVAFFKLTGGSWGLQLGGQATDLVLFFMTERSAASLLESKFTLGGQLGVAAGPVGRSAEASTDLKLDAEIYSYARSKGLFAGLSLEGARISADDSETRKYYGAAVGARALLFDHRAPTSPDASRSFLEALPGRRP